MQLVKELYNKQSPLAMKYGILSAPEIVTIKSKTGDWSSGADSLALILDSMEKQDMIEVEHQRAEDRAKQLKQREEAKKREEALRAKQIERDLKIQEKIQLEELNLQMLQN